MSKNENPKILLEKNLQKYNKLKNLLKEIQEKRTTRIPNNSLFLYYLYYYIIIYFFINSNHLCNFFDDF